MSLFMEAPPSIVDGDYSFADFREVIKETEKVFARFEKKFGREPESVEEFYEFLLAEEQKGEKK